MRRDGSAGRLAHMFSDQNECIAQSIEGSDHARGGLLTVNRDSYRRCMEQRRYTLA